DRYCQIRTQSNIASQPSSSTEDHSNGSQSNENALERFLKQPLHQNHQQLHSTNVVSPSEMLLLACGVSSTSSNGDSPGSVIQQDCLLPRELSHHKRPLLTSIDYSCLNNNSRRTSTNNQTSRESPGDPNETNNNVFSIGHNAIDNHYSNELDRLLVTSCQADTHNMPTIGQSIRLPSLEDLNSWQTLVHYSGF
ncbi:hypothetical protein GJ496_004644, partial [Pomphorhynchus laevis]